ncbi:conserved exported hypothetical protein [Candidatus Terasakiella magnetica]|nr:conserved exported hypothetical protein [Candidatus Terasakiella magnetica]
MEIGDIEGRFPWERVMIHRFAIVLCLASAPVLAAEYTCPDMAAITQVGNCASEQELQASFAGYCSDNARMYDKDDTSCLSHDHYKKLKDVALWESGEFLGYLHCSQTPEARKAVKSNGIHVAKLGKLTRVVCTYENGSEMALRTRSECSVQGDKAVCKD